MTKHPPRLDAPFGALIDRDKPVSFRFEGRKHKGFAGDTAASALWAEGTRVMARSFKYHRPRGPLSFTGFDGGVLVQSGETPNVPADRFYLNAATDGADVRLKAQNYLGSLRADAYSALGAMSRFLPVGFYYRTFFRPKGIWSFYEKPIRQLAGLGKLTPSNDHVPGPDKHYLFADVAVVGGGLAGLHAALAAADAGAEVILIEADPVLGGKHRHQMPYQRGDLESIVAKVASHDKIRVMTTSVAQALYADNWLAVETPHGLDKLRAGHVVIATGAFEQALTFRNNDLPGVMLTSAARRLMWDHGVKPGARAVVAGTDDRAAATALDLLEAGVEVAALADLRSERAFGEVHEELGRLGVRVLMKTGVYEAVSGRSGLSAVRLAQVEGDGEPLPLAPIPCDLLCMSAGDYPAAALAAHAGARLAYDKDLGRIAVIREGEHFIGLSDLIDLAGDVAGLGEEAAEDGRRAGLNAAARLGLATGEPVPTRKRSIVEGRAGLPVVRHPKGKEFVDFDEDLTAKDIVNATKDGFTQMELLKRYSTAGMGPSQGRFSASATVRLAAKAMELEPEELGTTTLRPPFTGLSFQKLAGRGFSPYRRTPMHERHEALGAQMMIAGLWHRPAFYGKPEEASQAISAEVAAVRENVGLIDVSTLGGIEIAGPDAAAFLTRSYTTAHMKQPIGRSRYVLLCDDTGAIIDDGIACRLGENRFYLTATTGQVDATYRKLLWLNAHWHLHVTITNVTGAFAAVNIAGPKSREVVQTLASDIDFSAEAFPYIDVRCGQLDGIPARAIRVGFVGELGYEFHVPMPRGAELWDKLMAAGEPFAIKPFGVEAQRQLRLEKGHVIIGQDTDGLTTPPEAGMPWAIAKTKPNGYLGQSAIEALSADGFERKLVGFKLGNPSGPVPPENALVMDHGTIAGRVTSAVRSHACQDVVGLAYVPWTLGDEASFTIKLPNGQMVTANVTSLPFYDPDNERQSL